MSEWQKAKQAYKRAGLSAHPNQWEETQHALLVAGDKLEAALADLRPRPNQVRALEAEEKLAWAEARIAELEAKNERLESTLDAIEDAFVKERNIYPKMSISWCNWRNALKVMDAVEADIQSREDVSQ